MRTETVTIPEHTITTTYYEYDELSDDAKESVKEWYLENREPWEFSEMVEDDLINLFGKNNLDIEYSLNYSQGDGLNIYGRISADAIFDCLEKHNAGTLFNKYENVLTDEEKRTILGYTEYCGMIKLPQNGRYGYCMADSIDIADPWEYDLDCYEVENVSYDLLKKFEQLVIDMFTDLCNFYKNWGYEFFYEIDDSDMSDICSCNDWEFDCEGNLR